MTILDGKTAACKRDESLKSRVSELAKTLGRSPKLAIVLVGDDTLSAHFVGLKKKNCEALGIECLILHQDEKITQTELEKKIMALNNDKAIDAILVQLPLPQHIDSNNIIELIDYRKDVDGLTSKNFGFLAAGKPYLVPCTAKGIVTLLKDGGVTLDGKRAVVVGRSNLVGKPTAQMLLRENCTVTVAHSKSANLAQIVANAEILVLAMGNPDVITPEMLRQGVTVVDVAMNRRKGKFVGDIYNAENLPLLREKCAAITPVPGGVGPMTIVSLMENIVTAAEKATQPSA